MNKYNNRRFIRTSTLMLIAFASILEGCNCEKSSGGLKPVPDWICAEQGTRPPSAEKACPSGGRYALGACMEARCDGEDGESCCPGMICATGGVCIVPAGPLTECENDGQCDVEGQRCLLRPRISETKTCGFPSVDENGECADGTPFNQRCVALAPCDGGCSEGWVCNIDTNSCETVPDLVTDASCQQACGDSSILVYADPDTMLFDQCCEVGCACLTLPPLEPGTFGRFSSMTKDEDDLIIASYDTTYGDLVVSTHSSSTGFRESIRYLDGVPANGTAVADPAGPRGGLTASGPNLGQHTAIANSETTIVVSYYDVDNTNLKLAQYNQASQEWSISSIHEDDGDIGRYTSIALDSNNIIHVTYYAHRIGLAPSEGAAQSIMTGVYYARSKNTAPTGPADWEISPVEIVPSCHGSCTSNESCVEINGQATCLASATSCENCEAYQSCINDSTARCETTLPENLELPCGDTCSDTQACIQAASGQSSCQTKAEDCDACENGTTCVEAANGTSSCEAVMTYPVNGGLPNGVGLFTSMAIYNNRPIVAYYDRIRRHLRGAQAQFEIGGDITNGFTSAALASDSDDDVGQQASLAVNKSQTAFSITYQALGGETLWVFQGSDILALDGTKTLIDNGVRESQINLVGASSSAAYDSDGNLYVAYGDQTNNDLVLAYPSDTGWKTQLLLEQGAAGSFNNILIEDRTAYVSTYVRLRDSLDKDISRLSIQTIDLDSLE